MKRLLSMVVAALVTVCYAAAPVAAASVTPPAPPSKGSIEIANTIAGKSYDIYRIFDMTLSADNVHFAYTINPAFKAFFDNKGLTDRAAAVNYVYSLENKESEITAFSNEVKTFALANNVGTGVKFTQVATGTVTVFNDIPLGYYLFYPEGTSNGLCNLTSTDPNSKIELKGDYPSVGKSIVESGDKKQGESYSLGDTVTYQLDAKVPDMTGFTKYFFVFNDKLSKGLTFNDNSDSIKIGSSTLLRGTDYTITKTVNADGSTSIKLVLIDFYNKYKDKHGLDIVVTYSATINSDAVVGPEGNSNEASIVYSNKPNTNYKGVNEPADDDPVDETPNDTVKVFVFDLSTTKVNGDNTSEKLADAEFALWTTKAPKNLTGAVTMTYKDNGTDVTLYQLTASLKTDKDGKFDYKIGAGKYYLFETKAPAGFNLLTEPLVFTVTATIEDNELKNLTVDNTAALRADKDTGVISTSIQNFSGIALPGTGGSGTKLFIMGGGILMCGSIVGMLISGKRKAKKS